MNYLIITDGEDGLVSTCIANATDQQAVNQYVTDNSIDGVVVAESDLPHHLDCCSIVDSAVVKDAAKYDAVKLAILRKERDALLLATDWWATGDRTMTAEQTAYRQALRDFPTSQAATEATLDEFKNLAAVWPTKPE